jgi:hypothetical protein
MSVDPGARGSAATAVAALGEAGHGVLPSPSSRAAALGAVLALAAAPFLGRAGIPAAMAALLLASVACQRRGDVAARNATLVAALTLATLFLPVGSWGWPAPVLLLAASALRSGWRGPDGLVPWLRAGSLRATDLAWVAAVVTASAGALVGWTVLRRPSIADLTNALPAIAPGLLLPEGWRGRR